MKSKEIKRLGPRGLGIPGLRESGLRDHRLETRAATEEGREVWCDVQTPNF